MAHLINVKNLYKIYNEGKESEVRALDGVSLTIDRGEFVSIWGSSGSGKSTLMNILGCLDVPTRGEYYLDGIDVRSLSDRKLSAIRNKEIGFIFQGFNLLHALSALENVELPLIYRGMGKRKRRELAQQALEKVSLGTRLHHKPSEMSGGQQQRVAVARAISTNPPIIMADEPTGNLDSRTGKEVMEILTHINEMGHTVLLITHDMKVARMARRIVKLEDGHIIGDELNTGEVQL